MIVRTKWVFKWLWFGACKFLNLNTRQRNAHANASRWTDAAQSGRYRYHSRYRYFSGSLANFDSLFPQLGTRQRFGSPADGRPTDSHWWRHPPDSCKLGFWPENTHTHTHDSQPDYFAGPRRHSVAAGSSCCQQHVAGQLGNKPKSMRLRRNLKAGGATSV